MEELFDLIYKINDICADRIHCCDCILENKDTGMCVFDETPDMWNLAAVKEALKAVKED